MPTFKDNSSSASNLSDKIIKLNDTKEGNIIRIVDNYWEEIPEVWIKNENGTRRFRATDEVQKLINDSGYDAPVKVYFYSPAVTGQRVRAKSKKDPSKIINKIQLSDICQILRYGKKVFRKLKFYNDSPDFEGDVTVRNLVITKTKMGGGKGEYIDYDVSANPAVSSLPETLEGVSDVIAEIKAAAEEVVDINALKKMLGLFEGEKPSKAGKEEVEEVVEEDDEEGEDKAAVEDDEDIQIDDEEEAKPAKPAKSAAKPVKEKKVEKVEEVADDDDDDELSIEDDEEEAKEEKAEESDDDDDDIQIDDDEEEEAKPAAKPSPKEKVNAAKVAKPVKPVKK